MKENPGLGKELPKDPGIPALRAPERLIDALGRTGVKLGPRVTFRILKHHLGARCTILMDSPTGRIVAKAYADDVSELAELMNRFAAAGLASGRPATPPPLIAVEPVLTVIVTAFLDERPCRDLIAAGLGPRAGELAAAWLNAVADTAIEAGPRYGPADLVREAKEWVVRLSRSDNELGSRGADLIGMLSVRLPPNRKGGLRHGSFSASHVFDLGGGPGVVDWDGFRQGPAEFDAGRFLAGLSSLAAGRRHLAGEAERTARSFMSELGAIVDEESLAWWRAASLLRLAYYASVRRPRRWPERSARLLDEAETRVTG